MTSKTKNRKTADETFERAKTYAPSDAVGLVKELAFAKFDESVDMSFRLGIDPRQADEIVRGTVSLPNGTGEDVRVQVRSDRGRG